MFCEKCKSMIFPKDGKYVCKKCGYEGEITRMKSNVKVSAPAANEIAVVSDDAVKLPKTQINCPKCGHPEAYYNIRQTRSADEPSTTFYRCCKCNQSWREY